MNANQAQRQLDFKTTRPFTPEFRSAADKSAGIARKMSADCLRPAIDSLNDEFEYWYRGAVNLLSVGNVGGLLAVIAYAGQNQNAPLSSLALVTLWAFTAGAVGIVAQRAFQLITVMLDRKNFHVADRAVTTMYHGLNRWAQGKEWGNGGSPLPLPPYTTAKAFCKFLRDAALIISGVAFVTGIVTGVAFLTGL